MIKMIFFVWYVLFKFVLIINVNEISINLKSIFFQYDLIMMVVNEKIYNLIYFSYIS